MLNKIINFVVLFLLSISVTFASSSVTTVNHAGFSILKQNFSSSGEASQACMNCHNNSKKHIQKALHWQRCSDQGKKDKFLDGHHSKRTDCTSCHKNFAPIKGQFGEKKNLKIGVDCLSCHDSTGKYKNSIKKMSPTLLREIVSNVKTPQKANCLNCHAYSGGDLDESFIHASKSQDIHLATDGMNFSCQQCHNIFKDNVNASCATNKTNKKMRITSGSKAYKKIGHFSCNNCHGGQPHDGTLNSNNTHARRMRCKACHSDQEMSPTGHGVKPKTNSKKCVDCHNQTKVPDFLEDRYIPGGASKTSSIINIAGILLLILTFLGVCFHGLGRAIFSYIRRKK